MINSFDFVPTMSIIFIKIHPETNNAISLKLHRLVNEHEHNLAIEHVTVMNQIVFYVMASGGLYSLIYIVLINYLCALDTTLRILNT